MWRVLCTCGWLTVSVKLTEMRLIRLYFTFYDLLGDFVSNLLHFTGNIFPSSSWTEPTSSPSLPTRFCISRRHCLAIDVNSSSGLRFIPLDLLVAVTGVVSAVLDAEDVSEAVGYLHHRWCHSQSPVHVTNHTLFHNP